MTVGELSEIHLKGWNRKEGRYNKIFKKVGGQLGQRASFLKRVSRNSLKNYVLNFI